MTASRDATTYTKVVHGIVKELLRKYPSNGFLKDDLVSAGYLGAVKACASQGIDLTEDYVATSVRNEMYQCLRLESTISVPPWKQNSVRIERENVDLDMITTEHQFDSIEDALDNADFLKTDEDRDIARLMVEGYTLYEISDNLGIPLRTLDRRLVAIRSRGHE